MKPRLIEALSTFVQEREWDQFHSPKNLLLALVSEVGELAEHFQWLTDEQIKELDTNKKEQVAEEVADVFLYLLLLAKKLNLDLEEEGLKKISKNIEKYPIPLAKGNARKYTEY